MQNTYDVSMRTNYTTQLDLAIQKIRNLKGNGQEQVIVPKENGQRAHQCQREAFEIAQK